HNPHEPLLTLMRHYFTLNLRADQARTTIHQQMQQNRYVDVFHGPPYERIEHWNRCLVAAKLDYEATEARWRGIVAGEEGGGVDVDFVKVVEVRSSELEELLEGMRGV
ncbi:hypothetical protein GQ44DRAFT_562424, partial [Phaeosphaeriaceae sp. PMI808]